MRVCIYAIAALVCAVPMEASAQSVRLTLEEALARAREQSPAVLIARARVEETKGRLVGARVRYRENPTLDVSGGPRRNGGGTTTDFEIGFGQTFELGGQRAARIAGAEAAVAAETATADDARRQALEIVATVFLEHQHAQERRALLLTAEQNGAEILRIAERRFQAGDIAVMEVNLARAAVARARSASVAADADVGAASGVLSRLLGMPYTRIETDEPLTRDRSADLAELLALVDVRPDLMALKSSMAEAQADVRLGQTSTRPDLGVDVRVKQEGSDHILLAGLTLTLPKFNSGQEFSATGLARASRLQLELETARASAKAEVSALHEEYERRQSAAAAFQDVLPLGTENEQLSQRSYEEGELSLADLVVVRREAIDTRLEFLDRLLEAAETAIARDAAAGVLK